MVASFFSFMRCCLVYAGLSYYVSLWAKKRSVNDSLLHGGSTVYLLEMPSSVHSYDFILAYGIAIGV